MPSDHLGPRLRLGSGHSRYGDSGLAALALGIATTIGIVAVVTILTRHTLGQALAQRLPQLERGARVLQGAAGVAIIAIGVLTLSQLRL